MGVPGLWDLLRPAGKTKSLVHLAVVDGFEKNRDGKRGYRFGIDASIWFFHAAYGKEGENPELRTLFFRLCRLAESPFLPLIVFDGPHRPDFKRGKKVNAQKQHWLESGVKRMINAFGWEWRQAPGEAEAELAYLNRIGVIDAVLSDDVDNFLFGAQVVIRNPSNNLSGNKSNPNKNSDGRDDGKHTMVFRAKDFETNEEIGLTRNGMVLIGLLSGGDYQQEGLFRCGKIIAQGLAKCGFGDSLVNAYLTLPSDELPAFIDDWREQVIHELRTNSRGLIGRKNPTLAKSFPKAFPNIEVLKSYVTPLTTESRGKVVDDSKWWMRDMDIAEVASCCEQFFEWGIKDIIVKRFRTVLWPGACCRILRQAAMEQDRRDRRRADVSATPKKSDSKRPPKHLAVGTPSKLITRYFSKLGLNSPEKAGSALDDDDGDDEDEKDPLMIKIHSSRTHASTDGILEYRVEIAPKQLVRLAESGVQGTRNPEDLAQGDTYSDLENGDEDDEGGNVGGKKKKPKPPPDPFSVLRVWLPATMMEYVQPGLVEDWEAKEEAKRLKKEGKGKGKARPKTKQVDKGSDEEEEEKEPVKPKGKARAKAPVKMTQPRRRLWESSDEEEEEEGVSPIQPSKPQKVQAPPMAQQPSPPNSDDDADVPSRLKKMSPIASSKPRTQTAEPKGFAFTMACPDTDSEIEEPPSPSLPPPPVPRQVSKPVVKSKPAPPAPVPSSSKVAQMLDSLQFKKSPAKPVKATKAKSKPKSKDIPKTKALTTAMAFFDDFSSDSEPASAKKGKAKAASYSLKPPPVYSRSQSATSSTAVGSSAASTAAESANDIPLKVVVPKKARNRSALSSPSGSDVERKEGASPRKSPRKSTQQTSPERVRPASPSPPRRLPIVPLKAKQPVDYIEISSSSDEGGALLLKVIPGRKVVPPTREQSASAKPAGITTKSVPSSKQGGLNSFGFAVKKGLPAAHMKSGKLMTKVPSKAFHDVIDLT